MLSQDNRNAIIKLKLKLQKRVKEARAKARDSQFFEQLGEAGLESNT